MHDGGNDRLDKMWKLQFEQQDAFNLNPRGMTAIARSSAVKDLMLGLYEEVSELSGIAASYKAHVLRAQNVEKVNVADAVADIMKYLFSVAQLYNVTQQEVYEAFERKTDVVNDKARGERLELERDTRVILVDLDNCVSDLSQWQNKLSEARGTAPMNDRTMALLESLKADFYRDGGFIHMPPVAGAPDGMRVLSEMGYKLVVVTARPYWQYKRLYADTLNWLKEYDVAYDLILFNKDKAEAIYEHIFPARPTFFIEDRDKHAMEVAGIGVPVLLLDYPHNRTLPDNPLIKRVLNWKDIVQEAKNRMER